MKTIRIACGQGFWGDSLDAPLDLLAGGGLNYLVLDYLAEVTMSILSKQRQKEPSAGYARDFVSFIERALPLLIKNKTKVIANAGGVNPRSCAEQILAVLKTAGVQGQLRVAIVLGDDILPDLSELAKAGESFSHLETGASFSEIRNHVQSANVYLGAESVLKALQLGADIVVTGRVADPSLVLAPLRHEFSWAENDWDRLASGIVAGHIIECGAQCTGGNCSYEWQSIPDFDRIGYPYVEVSEDGSFLVSKQVGSGGRVDAHSVKEQLVYEIGDPKNYITPDVIADFTSLRLEDLGNNTVKISGVRGKPRPEKLKASISYRHGFMAFGTLVYTWPDAYQKAEAAGEIVKKRLARAGVTLERLHIEFIGAGACHEGTVPRERIESAEEILLRIAVWDKNRNAVERFTREMAPLVLNGPPGATAYAGGKRQVQEVFAYWPSLLGRDKISPRVEVLS